MWLWLCEHAQVAVNSRCLVAQQDGKVLRGGAGCMSMEEHVLLACSLAVLGGLEHLLSAVVALLDIVLCFLTPILLMLQGGVLAVQVPWRAGHILRDMWIDFFAVFVDRCGCQASLPSLFELFGSSEVLMTCRLIVC